MSVHIKHFLFLASAYSFLLLIGFLSPGLFPTKILQIDASTTRDITFPIIGSSRFSNDFYAYRSAGQHGATDIFANKLSKIVSPVNGTITFVPNPEPSYGWMVSIRDDDGYRYNFLHINNDTPGTDNGRGGAMNAYALDVHPGNRVVRGQMIGRVGDSGNAENTSPHLHFEIVTPSGNLQNPYYALTQANHISKNVAHPALASEILPWGASNVALRVDMGNFDGDQASEIVTATNRIGQVKTFEGDKTPFGLTIAPYAGYTGIIDVTAGDVDGDGIDEIITSQEETSSLIKIFKLDGTVVGQFSAYGAGIGARVSAGDVDGDGNDEIITGPSGGMAPLVKIFETTGVLVNSFNAYAATFTGGVDVASGDVTNVTGEPALVKDEIITGPGPTGGSDIKVFDVLGNLSLSFPAYFSTFTNGARVAVGNVKTNTPKAEILVAVQGYRTPSKGSPNIQIFRGDGLKLQERYFMEKWWLGYNDIGAGYDKSWASTGVNRRGSIRFAFD